jgi:hypothetical protein
LVSNKKLEAIVDKYNLQMALLKQSISELGFGGQGIKGKLKNLEIKSSRTDFIENSVEKN